MTWKPSNKTFQGFPTSRAESAKIIRKKKFSLAFRPKVSFFQRVVSDIKHQHASEEKKIEEKKNSLDTHVPSPTIKITIVNINICLKSQKARTREQH
jgi:hypothetical protein